MKDVTYDFGLISNFIYVVYMKGTFNPMLIFKTKLST